MTDEFSNARERSERHPTFAAYCKSRNRDELALLICSDEHRNNVFGTYPGTTRDHARTIINEAYNRGREAERDKSEIPIIAGASAAVFILWRVFA
jgi:hypothetical protein